MKKIAFLLLIIVAGLVSCNKEYSIHTFYYQNHSGYDLVIEEYKRQYPEYTSLKLKNRTEIDNNDIYIYIYDHDPEVEGDPPFQDMYMVRIVFNNERALTYYSANREGVYLGGGNYVQEKVDDYHYNYYYTFTPEMYEEAIPLDELEEPEAKTTFIINN